MRYNPAWRRTGDKPYKMRFNPTTPVKYYYPEEGKYIPGQGATKIWKSIECLGNDTFYCEWRNAFGDRALSAQALGVQDYATIRTFYNPAIYEKLITERVVVVKNADVNAIKDGVPDKTNRNVYEIWGGVDNVQEENRYMEFRVRRYEGL